MKIKLLIGGFGVDLIKYCESYDNYEFINYYSIQTTQSNFIPKMLVIGYPITEQDAITILSNNEMEKQIRKLVDKNKNIIMYSRLCDINYTINHLKLAKILGYKIKIIYYDMNLDKQINNVNINNLNPNFLINYTLEYITLVNNNIIENIDKIKCISDTFKIICL